jgi:hypothetical protein
MSEFTTVVEFNAELENLTTQRESAKGAAKSKLTKSIKKLETERDAFVAAEAAKDEAAAIKVKLADLETQMIEKLREAGVEVATAENIAPLGDPVVDAGQLEGYTAKRYNAGRWVSAAILKRVNRALKADAVAAEPVAA